MNTDTSCKSRRRARKPEGARSIALAFTICLLCAAAGGTNEQLSEEAQLDLLEEAEAHYAMGPDRDNATAIALYEEVLAKVNLDPRIRLEIELRVANLHFHQARAGERDIPAALAWYDAIVERYPITEPEAFDALANRGYALSKLEREDEAEAAHLETRRTYFGLAAEHQARLRGKWRFWNINTLNHLIMRYGRKGVDGVPELEGLTEAAHPEDTELVREVDEAIRILQQAHETLAPFEGEGVGGLADFFRASHELQGALASEMKADDLNVFDEARSTVQILQALVGAEGRRILDRIDPDPEDIRALLQEGAIPGVP